MNVQKKRRTVTVLCVMIAIVTCAAALVAALALTPREPDELPAAPEQASADGGSSTQEMRAVWIAYYSELDITPAKIDEMVSNSRDAGFNAIIFHVRPFGDAMYPSEYFPWSHIACGRQGEAPADGFDPLGYAVEKAHEAGMELHAWINPLRIQFEGGTSPENLSPDNPYVIWRGDGDPSNDGYVVDHRGGKYYNPAAGAVRQLISDGIAEIVRNYNVDGIHWDDYFYPASDESFDDGAYYRAYTAQGGEMTLSEWRTENINMLVRQCYSTVKAIRPECVFGISPAGNIGNCLEAGADVYEWCSHSGYIDYICPQVYWPFSSTVAPFDAVSLRWKDMVKADGIRFYVGLALYKGGSETADSGHWTEADDIIARQIEYCRSDALGADGYMVFSYADLFSDAARRETENMIKANRSGYGAQ